MDCLNFGTILYYMVGLAPELNYYLTFMGIVFVFNVLMSELLFVFATFAVTKATVQIASACLVFFFMLFCGFIIAPDLIPNFYQWIYWYNPLAWAYRALVLNEFRSSKYTEEESNSILIFAGFTYSNGKPFGSEWIMWAFVYMLCHICATLITSSIILSCIRVVGETPPSFEAVERADLELRSHEDGHCESGVTIPFKPITVSFEKVCYDVKTSTGGEDLRLLNDIYGYFKAGRMCALMGESGAGKTTLMDVIAMRKNTGIISGEVRVNGFPQDRKTFRRCSGYVEQFDVQSPQLTVRETVLFSARLRLDGSTVTAEDKQKFSDMVLKTLELTPLADSLVGNADEGGLSFEQRKRLSIAVELAASPSIIFLDEVS
jgi:ABC-type lipoprotein export system ATPase subunit